MTFNKSFSLVFLSFLLCSCAGDLPKTGPVRLRAGTEQIIKGNAFYQKGCYKTAFEHFIRAHELYTASDQMDGIAMSLNNIGSVYRALGEPGRAMVFYSEAERTYKNAGNQAALGQVLSNEAAALIDAGDLCRAEDFLKRAEQIQGADQKIRAPLLTNRGILLARKGQFKEAEALLNEALAVVGPSGAKADDRAADQASASSTLIGTAATHFALGNLMMDMKRYHEAADHFKAALVLDRQSGFYKGIADDLVRLGHLARTQGDEASAYDYWTRSLKIYTLIGLERDRVEMSNLLKQIPQPAKGTGDANAFFLDRWEKGKRLENPCED
jgi:tetratricopeptide (TPR) repeat protein